MTEDEELDGLLAARATAHRMGAPAMTSRDELQDWVEDRSLALVSGRSAVPSAAEAIVGRPIEGSWWGDPEGALIYRLLTAIATSPISDLVLLDGKRTLIAPRLLPAVEIVAADPERRQRVRAVLTAPGRLLLDLLDEDRAVRADDTPLSASEFRKARGALEAALLARSTSVHTEAGHHVSLVTGFGGEEAAGPNAGEGQAALRSLLASALRSAVVASRREVDGWLRFVEPDAGSRSAAVDTLGARQLAGPGGPWMTLEP